jgi:hypothetical protein
MEIAVYESIVPNALIGNKSHKAKLENVRLQIVALRAVEAQLEEWISEEPPKQNPEIEFKLSNEQVKAIIEKMKSENLMRASSQSAEWAGHAVIQSTAGPQDVAIDWREHAHRVLKFMEGVGAIRKTAIVDPVRGRPIPMYEVRSFPL